MVAQFYIFSFVCQDHSPEAGHSAVSPVGYIQVDWTRGGGRPGFVLCHPHVSTLMLRIICCKYISNTLDAKSSEILMHFSVSEAADKNNLFASCSLGLGMN